MDNLINQVHEPVVRYGLYTETMAPIMMELSSRVEGDTAEIVPLSSEEDINEAAILWSSQLEERFVKKQAKYPEFARRKELPSLYTIDGLRKTLGSTVHVLMKVTAPSEEEVLRLTNVALRLAI